MDICTELKLSGMRNIPFRFGKLCDSLINLTVYGTNAFNEFNP